MTFKIPANLNVLVIGSGGREHALCWKLAQSEHVDKIYCAPGNGGTAQERKTTNVDVAVMDFLAQVSFCRQNRIDLVVIGPDDPLAAGAVDVFQSAGIRVFGPCKDAAQLESSKAFAKQFMSQNRIPTARYLVFDNLRDGLAAVSEHPWARVIKVDGLALGKGVFVCDTVGEAESALKSIFSSGKFGDAGRKVVIEERLAGEEISLLLFCDGKQLVEMPSSRDHKRRYDGDRGPNTGGMGVFSPIDLYRQCREEIYDQILKPIKKALQSRALDYRGILYIGLMVEARKTPAGKRAYQPYVLEFNARFGDPETQALLPLLKSDLLPVLFACTEGKLGQVQLEWHHAASCCVVACAGDYPQSGSRGEVISFDQFSVGQNELEQKRFLFHAGTASKGSDIITNGGRVFAVTGVGDNIDDAAEVAYRGIEQISFCGMSYRKDIGRRAGAPCLLP